MSSIETLAARGAITGLLIKSERLSNDEVVNLITMESSERINEFLNVSITWYVRISDASIRDILT